MSYRNIFIANQAALSVKNCQLVVDNGEKITFPIEDIRSVMIESRAVTLSSYLISQLAESGVCLIFCDSSHLPSAMLMPINCFSRQNKRIELQFSQSQPNIKRLWQSIVTSKIENQARALELCGKNGEKVRAISKSVLSGDTTNREAFAANIYFKELFGADFKRSEENFINGLLNYGYAIIRAYICRTLAIYGLEPSLGIHHKNEYNHFNLGDDIIEPFRPVVDLYVYNHYSDKESEIGTKDKVGLQMLLNSAIIVMKEKISVANAIEKLVQSLVKSFETMTPDLKTPELIMTSFFEYE